jgi:hypothetical protein
VASYPESNVGVVFASTGGNKIVRAVRTFQRMEPDVPVHVTIATNTATYRNLNKAHELQLRDLGAAMHLIEPAGFVNGGMNAGIRWMRELGYSHACVLHDDLVFSPLPDHRGSLFTWFAQDWSQVSGITFAHFETLTSDPDFRREPERWDAQDLENPVLWRDLMTFDREHNGSPVYPAGRDFFVRYEGTDRTRPWNRLGPTGFIVPIALWEAFDGFDETYGLFYDHDYPANCFLRGLAPVYAVPNVPWMHLHNQSVNPWADRADGLWGDSDGAFARKFDKILTDFWWGNWEQRWLDMNKTTATNTGR